jgi:hypothetical protein
MIYYFYIVRLDPAHRAGLAGHAPATDRLDSLPSIVSQK